MSEEKKKQDSANQNDFSIRMMTHNLNVHYGQKKALADVNLEFPLKRNLGIYDRPKLQSLVKQSLEDVGLESAINMHPAELSGGMKKRVGIARTLILNPKIMLYDEPTAGLDPETAAEINELILTVRKKYHTASIIITHDLSCARQVSDRIVALFDGRNKLEGTFEELKQQNAEELQSFFNY